MRAFTCVLSIAISAPLSAALFPTAPSDLTTADSVQLAWGVRIPMRDGVRLNATV